MTHRYFYLTVAAIFLVLSLCSGPSWAAVGCDLNDPERDVPRLFPGSTRYDTVTVELLKLGGDALRAKVEMRLRDKLRGLYEAVDVPYTIYVIYADKKRIGYIHGVNQKGRYGGIQVFVILDLDARIKGYYIQRMSGTYAGKFRDGEFEKQFIGLTLADFDQYDVPTGKGTGKVAEIKNPAPEAIIDFKFTMRGTKKNLILVDEFLKNSPELSLKDGASTK
jgi:hypothetical protein